MNTYRCNYCGYRQNEMDAMETLLEFSVYPAYEPSLMMPLMALETMQGAIKSCPNCGKNTHWMEE